METLINVHPGEILKEEYLDPLGISNYKLAKNIGIQQIQVSRIIKGELNITPDIAVRLGKFFGNSAESWINLQRNHDLRKIRHEKRDLIEQIPNFKNAG